MINFYQPRLGLFVADLNQGYFWTTLMGIFFSTLGRLLLVDLSQNIFYQPSLR